MNNQPIRVLYESVGKLAGINVLQDPSGIETVAGKNFNLDLNNVSLEEALNYIALETHTFWKPISRNAIFVTQESDPKRQEYQDEVVKVFYIQNSSTPNEFTEIFNAVRTGRAPKTGVFSVPSQSAIIARGSVDTMALVEKLVHDLDHPKAEVVIDVIVMSVNKTKIDYHRRFHFGNGRFQPAVNVYAAHAYYDGNDFDHLGGFFHQHNGNYWNNIHDRDGHDRNHDNRGQYDYNEFFGSSHAGAGGSFCERGLLDQFSEHGGAGVTK